MSAADWIGVPVPALNADRAKKDIAIAARDNGEVGSSLESTAGPNLLRNYHLAFDRERRCH